MNPRALINSYNVIWLALQPTSLSSITDPHSQSTGMLPSNIEIDAGARDAAPVSASKPIRWMPLIGLFCLGGLSAMVARGYFFSQDSAAATDRAWIVESIPQVDIEPDEVVRQQLDSMRAAVTKPDALITCYSLASPANRKLTGPYERFARLVNIEPYRQIGLCQDFQVGTPVIDGRTASVLVSILAQDGQGLAFQFLLGKQSAPPYLDCWMTDGVYPLLPLDSSQTRLEPSRTPASKVDAL